MRLKDFRVAVALRGAAVLALGVTLAAAAANPLPYAQSFERATVGQGVGALPGWSGTDAALVSTQATALAALASYTNAGGTLPLLGPHAQILQAAGRATLALSAPSGERVRTDFLVLPTRARELPFVDPDAHLVLTVLSNGLFAVAHRDPLTGSNLWTGLAGGPTLDTGVWVRVSVEQDYTARLFQVRFNGGAPVDDPAGWSGPGGVQPGPWFHMLTTGGVLTAIAIADSEPAFLDDLVAGADRALIETQPATAIGVGAATFNGSLVYTGMPAAVEVYWGPADGGTNAAAWAHLAEWPAPRSPGAYPLAVTGLVGGVTWYRYAALDATARAWADTTATVLADPVWVTGRDTQVGERPPDPGVFRIERPATATGGAVTVTYTLGGTASNGFDYAMLHGSATIPDGGAYVDVSVLPVLDGVVEDLETVVLTLQPGAYALGAPTQATVFITDAQPQELFWLNTSGDMNWSDSSTNWSGAQVFYDGDEARFSGTATGRVYVGRAVWSAVSNRWFATVPRDVRSGRTIFFAGIYDFEGGGVVGGPVEISGGARVLDRNLSRLVFGGGDIALTGGGEFWRQVPPDTAAWLQTVTNPVTVVGTGLLQGGRGTNEWRGALELRGRLNVGITNAAPTHLNRFTGPITLNQNPAYAGPRVLALRGGGGTAVLEAPIADGPATNPAGAFPLVLETGAGAGPLILRGANTWSYGTVVTNAGSTNGVTVAAGSSLGTGAVLVTGTGAWLRVEGAGAIAAPLTVASNATVVLAADGALATGCTQVHVLDRGLLVLLTSASIPDTSLLALTGAARVQLAAGVTATVGDLYIDGVRKRGGLYTQADLPGSLVGPGALRVVGPPPDGPMIVVR